MAVWGLISDVHGNLAALREAVHLLRAEGAERLGFLGDYLGRGDPDGCVRLIREVASAAVVGNRDLDWRDRVSEVSRGWVLSLPRTFCQDGLLLAHGDARLTRDLSTTQIRRDFDGSWKQMETCGARVFAFGHSHHARVWRKASADDPAQPVAAEEWPLEGDYRYVVNVGSTGLPVPGKGGPSVAVLDLDRGVGRLLPLSNLTQARGRPPLQS